MNGSGWRGGSLLRGPDLSRRAVHLRELMDSPDCDPDALERTYRGFGLVNTAVAGWQLTYRRWLRPLLRPDGVTRVLDIGCGGGDLARALARRARRDGFEVQITGADPDPRAHDFAVRQDTPQTVRFLRATSADLVAAGERFDLVISNHLLHHLGDAELQGLLADSERLAHRRAVHSDIHRAPWAYRLFGVGTLPVHPRSFIRTDGLTSIRRSYTPDELRAVLPAGWQAVGQVPWRSLAVYTAERAGRADGPGRAG